MVPFDATTEYDHEASLYSGGYPEEIIIDSIELSDILSDGENVFSVKGSMLVLLHQTCQQIFFSHLE